MADKTMTTAIPTLAEFIRPKTARHFPVGARVVHGEFGAATVRHDGVSGNYFDFDNGAFGKHCRAVPVAVPTDTGVVHGPGRQYRAAIDEPHLYDADAPTEVQPGDLNGTHAAQ